MSTYLELAKTCQALADKIQEQKNLSTDSKDKQDLQSRMEEIQTLGRTLANEGGVQLLESQRNQLNLLNGEVTKINNFLNDVSKTRQFIQSVTTVVNILDNIIKLIPPPSILGRSRGMSLIMDSSFNNEFDLAVAPDSKTYYLRSGDFNITYSTAGSLDYQKGETSLHFEGDQIDVHDSDIGQQVRVTIDFETDTSNRFTLLLPNGSSDSSDITAVGIETHHVIHISRVLSYTLLTGNVSSTLV